MRGLGFGEDDKKIYKKKKGEKKTSNKNFCFIDGLKSPCLLILEVQNVARLNISLIQNI